MAKVDIRPLVDFISESSNRHRLLWGEKVEESSDEAVAGIGTADTSEMLRAKASTTRPARELIFEYGMNISYRTSRFEKLGRRGGYRILKSFWGPEMLCPQWPHMGPVLRCACLSNGWWRRPYKPAPGITDWSSSETFDGRHSPDVDLTALPQITYKDKHLDRDDARRIAPRKISGAGFFIILFKFFWLLS